MRTRPKLALVVRPRHPTRHVVWLRVTDPHEPEGTRWVLQRYIARAAGFVGYKGFNDAAARKRRWHRFEVNPRLLRRFKHDVRWLVASSMIEVEIDDRRLTPAAAARA